MAKKEIPNISTTRLSQSFRAAFPRVTPASRDYLEVTDDEDDYPVPGGADLPPGAGAFRLSDYPAEGAIRLEPSLNLKDFIPDLNQVVLFRALHRVFGDHDIPYMALLEKKHMLALAWGYAVRISPRLVCVVEGKGARVEIAPFAIDAKDIDLNAKERESLVNLVRQLSELHTNSIRLFDEGAFIKHKNTHMAYINLYQEKFRGAELLLRMATDRGVKGKLDEWELDELLEGQVKPESKGFLLISAAVLYFIALEALINLTYAILLKDSLRSDHLVVELIKKDLHVRLNCMHIFCDHFTSAPFSAESELPARVGEFQTWRNKVIHADLSDDLRIYSALEDGVLLHYFPAVDNRGHNRAAAGTISRFQPKVRSKDVMGMRQIVDDVRTAILAALDENTSPMLKAAIERNAIGRNIRS